ncbi:MAG: hypothetical protein RL662_296 [Bacteroidota bacterium]|jgi:hypothetical protein
MTKEELVSKFSNIETEIQVKNIIDSIIKGLFENNQDITPIKALLNQYSIYISQIEGSHTHIFAQECLLHENFVDELEKLKSNKSIQSELSGLLQYEDSLKIYKQNLLKRLTYNGRKMSLCEYAKEYIALRIENLEKELLQYTFDEDKILNVYRFCLETHIISEEISESDFFEAVSQADFRKIHLNAEQQNAKSKCKYIIFILSWLVNGDKWYLNTAQSVGTEPNRCSGINVPYKWKQEAETLRK